MKTTISVWDNYTGRIDEDEVKSYSHAVRIATNWVNEYYSEKAPNNYKIEMEFNYYNDEGYKIEKLRKSIILLRGSDINRFRKIGIAI